MYMFAYLKPPAHMKLIHRITSVFANIYLFSFVFISFSVLFFSIPRNTFL